MAGIRKLLRLGQIGSDAAQLAQVLLIGQLLEVLDVDGGEIQPQHLAAGTHQFSEFQAAKPWPAAEIQEPITCAKASALQTAAAFLAPIGVLAAEPLELSAVGAEHIGHGCSGLSAPARCRGRGC